MQQIMHQTIILKPTEVADLDYFFRFQLDPEAGFLAAFMPKNPADKPAYIAKYTALLNNPTVLMRTIFAGDTIVGSISTFVLDGETELTYWLDRAVWGQGIATKALNELLTIAPHRPVYARVAFDNIGSQRVLTKCGFVKIGTDHGFANARQADIEEYIYRLS
nr:GNAT family N-acetyltransferase [uncultured Arsenicibacter sp.]